MRKHKSHEHIRESVAKDYTRAVTKKSCCCKSKKPIQKGVVAKLAGYTDAELAALPTEAITNSFGCGNPLAFAEIKTGDTVLDLGSGAGIDLLLAARKVGPKGKVIGIDMTDAMITKAKENIAKAKLHNIEVRKGIIENLPVDSASIDFVISNCVINLSPHKEQVFSEIARVLKPGGTMIVSDIIAEYLPQEIIDHPDLYSSCLSGAINETLYIAGLKAAGLIDVAVRERLIYDATQLKAFISSELNETLTSSDNSRNDEAKLKIWVKELEGKVWSAKIYAKKPT